jgi:hypothetical protein
MIKIRVFREIKHYALQKGLKAKKLQYATSKIRQTTLKKVFDSIIGYAAQSVIFRGLLKSAEETRKVSLLKTGFKSFQAYLEQHKMIR